MQFEEFADCLAWGKNRKENERAWRVQASEILASGCNLDGRNPSSKIDISHSPPEQIVESLIDKETRVRSILEEMHSLLRTEK